MTRRNKNRSIPVTRAISWTLVMGLLFVVLHINAIMVADSWSDYRTQGGLAVFAESGSGIHIDPDDRSASN